MMEASNSTIVILSLLALTIFCELPGISSKNESSVSLKVWKSTVSPAETVYSYQVRSKMECGLRCLQHADTCNAVQYDTLTNSCDIKWYILEKEFLTGTSTNILMRYHPRGYDYLGVNVDSVGKDIGRISSNRSSLQDAATHCDGQSSCVAFIYYQNVSADNMFYYIKYGMRSSLAELTNSHGWIRSGGTFYLYQISTLSRFNKYEDTRCLEATHETHPLTGHKECVMQCDTRQDCGSYSWHKLGERCLIYYITCTDLTTNEEDWFTGTKTIYTNFPSSS